jgi:hypothetical protein
MQFLKPSLETNQINKFGTTKNNHQQGGIKKKLEIKSVSITRQVCCHC